MQALIAAQDPMVVARLSDIIGRLDRRMRVAGFDHALALLEHWREYEADLICCDQDLGGYPGREVLARIRRENPGLPLVLISGDTGRAAVLAARQAGISSFIAKPFDPELIADRLRQLLDLPAEPACERSLASHLQQRLDASLFLPALREFARPSPLAELTVQQLHRLWRSEPAISARLITAANSARFNRSGSRCEDLAGALQRLGVRNSVNLVTGLSFRNQLGLRQPLLRREAEHWFGRAQRLAETSALLASRCEADVHACYTAGLLHCLGELAVLEAVSGWLGPEQVLDQAGLQQALRQYASLFGNRIKVAWRLPLPLRRLIGGIYLLPVGVTRKEVVLMHLAGLLCADTPPPPTRLKALCQRLGIKPEQLPAQDPATPAT